MRFFKRSLDSVDGADPTRKSNGELRFTISLEILRRMDRTNIAYYRRCFSDTIQENFYPISGEVGKPYRYVLPFEEFNKVTLPGVWSFLLDNIEGFDQLGLNVETSGCQLIISGNPFHEFNGKIHVDVYPRTESTDGCFHVNRNIVINSPRPCDVDSDPSARANSCSSRSTTSVTPVLPMLDAPVASQWQEIDPPNDVPYQTKNYVCCGEQICLEAPLTVLGASQRGRLHAHNGKFREDAFQMTINRDQTVFGGDSEYGWHILVVSDGAGSAKYSRKGAQLICDCVAKKLSDTLNRVASARKVTEEISRRIIDAHRAGTLESHPTQSGEVIGTCRLDVVFYNALGEAYAEILKETSRIRECGEKANVSDFSATALCVAMKRFLQENDSWKLDPSVAPPLWAIVSYWIGDGAIAIYRPNYSCYSHADARELSDGVLLLGSPDVGEYAGETRFLTSRGEIDSHDNLERNLHNVRKRMRLTFLRSFEALFMATDGVTDPFFDVEKQLADFIAWRKFWNGKFVEYFPGVLDIKRTPQERAQALLDGMMFSERGYHDDRTVLLALNDNVVEKDGSIFLSDRQDDYSNLRLRRRLNDE